jgi:16S rRNA processing protein RimM
MSRKAPRSSGQPNRPDDRESQPTGSPDKSEPVFIAVGLLRRSHGVSGEMIMDVLTDFPERLRNRKVFLGEKKLPNRILSLRKHNRAMIVALEGCSTPEATAGFRNAVVYVRADQLPELPEGEYYHHELLGLLAVTEDGRELGRLEQILETGANDVYLVRQADGGELLLPAVEDVIVAYEIKEGKIVVRPQEWA